MIKGQKTTILKLKNEQSEFTTGAMLHLIAKMYQKNKIKPLVFQGHHFSFSPEIKTAQSIRCYLLSALGFM